MVALDDLEDLPGLMILQFHDPVMQHGLDGSQQGEVGSRCGTWRAEVTPCVLTLDHSKSVRASRPGPVLGPCPNVCIPHPALEHCWNPTGQ